MRCQKCGLISFDWLETCSKCGTSLSQERELLGRFIPDNGDVNWFSEVEAPDTEIVKEIPTIGAAADISQVDVSDLVADSGDQDVVEIEEKELLRAAEDEEFQKALEEIAP